MEVLNKAFCFLLMLVFILLFAIVLVLLETTFLDFPLVLFLVAFLSLRLWDFKRVFLLAFLIGFFYDFFSGDLLGQTALVFLGLSLVAFFYRKKFVETHLFFEIIFCSFSFKLWQIVNGEMFFWKKLGLFIGLALFLRFFFKKLGFLKRRTGELLTD